MPSRVPCAAQQGPINRPFQTQQCACARPKHPEVSREGGFGDIPGDVGLGIRLSAGSEDPPWRRKGGARNSAGKKLVQHLKITANLGVPVGAQWLTNPTRNHEVAGLIPGLTQWVKDPALP